MGRLEASGINIWFTMILACSASLTQNDASHDGAVANGDATCTGDSPKHASGLSVLQNSQAQLRAPAVLRDSGNVPDKCERETEKTCMPPTGSGHQFLTDDGCMVARGAIECNENKKCACQTGYCLEPARVVFHGIMPLFNFDVCTPKSSTIVYAVNGTVGEETGVCKFPFKYGVSRFRSCTTYLASKPWCCTDTNCKHWGYCDFHAKNAPPPPAPRPGPAPTPPTVATPKPAPPTLATPKPAPPTLECNWQCYLDRHPDLQNKFGATNTAAAQNHYQTTGQNEGRDCTCPASTVRKNCQNIQCKGHDVIVDHDRTVVICTGEDACQDAKIVQQNNAQHVLIFCNGKAACKGMYFNGNNLRGHHWTVSCYEGKDVCQDLDGADKCNGKKCPKPFNIPSGDEGMVTTTTTTTTATTATTTTTTPTSALYTRIAVGKRCHTNRWLNEYNSDPAVCLSIIQGRSDCSQQYFNHAIGDGNCGCVGIGSDCSDAANQVVESPVRIYQIKASLRLWSIVGGGRGDDDDELRCDRSWGSRGDGICPSPHEWRRGEKTLDECQAECLRYTNCQGVSFLQGPPTECILMGKLPFNSGLGNAWLSYLNPARVPVLRNSGCRGTQITEGVSLSTIAYVQCCSIFGDECFRPGGSGTFERTRETCLGAGKRLCTTAELDTGLCCGKGRGLDSNRVWATTTKALLMPVGKECDIGAQIIDKDDCKTAAMVLGLNWNTCCGGSSSPRFGCTYRVSDSDVVFNWNTGATATVSSNRLAICLRP